MYFQKLLFYYSHLSVVSAFNLESQKLVFFSLLLIILVEKLFLARTKREFETKRNLERRGRYEVRNESALELGEINNKRRQSA